MSALLVAGSGNHQCSDLECQAVRCFTSKSLSFPIQSVPLLDATCWIEAPFISSPLFTLCALFFDSFFTRVKWLIRARPGGNTMQPWLQLGQLMLLETKRTRRCEDCQYFAAQVEEQAASNTQQCAENRKDDPVAEAKENEQLPRLRALSTCSGRVRARHRRQQHSHHSRSRPTQSAKHWRLCLPTYG